MPVLRITGFDGLIPRTSPTMLGDSNAQEADNVKLYARELRYWRGPAFEFTPAISDVKTIYKYYSSDPDPIWLTWDKEVNVVPSATADTTDFRLYYTGDGAPKKTNLTLVKTGSGAYPRGSRPMGVPAPTGAPAVSASGGSGTPESRVYVYTYVTTFGSITEESAPSPASSIVSVNPGGTVTVNSFTAAPSGYGITHIRIYRSVTGAETDSYQFVAEITTGAGTYSDTKTAAQLGEVIKTIGWLPPPSDLKGLLTLPNGSLVGFAGNTVYFSEPYYPHAWPLAYALNVAYPIVGLGIYGTSTVVMTDRYPYIITGYTPGSMSVERVPILEPCVSSQSIVSDEDGVLYASPNGLVGIGPSMRGLVTQNIFRRDEWQAIQPNLMRGVVVDAKYFGVLPTTAETKAIVISKGDVPALSYLSLSSTAMHVDSKSGSLYYVEERDNKIYKLDADELNPLTYEWRSKRFVLPQATAFSCLKLDAAYEQSADAAAYNATVQAIITQNNALFTGPLKGAVNATPVNTFDVNGSVLVNLPPPASFRTAQVFVYGDQKLQASLSITSFDPVRLPPFKSREVEVKITGNLNVRSVALATTVPELREP